MPEYNPIHKEAEKLISEKNNVLFSNELERIIKRLSSGTSISEEKILTAEINLGEGLTKTFGNNSIQINKLGNIILILSSGWHMEIKEHTSYFLITFVSPGANKFRCKISGTSDTIHSIILNNQKISLSVLEDGSIFLSVFYICGFNFIPLFGLIFTYLSSRKIYINFNHSILEDTIDNEYNIKDMEIHPVTIELGKELLVLMSPKLKKQFLERINSIKKHLVMDTGILFPPVRIKDNMGLKNREFLLLIKDVPVASGEIYMKKFLAIGPENQINSLPGKKVLEPTYNMSGIWINYDQKNTAERTGFMIFDPISVVAMLLTEVLRKHAYQFLGIEETEELLHHFLKSHPVVYRELLNVVNIIEINKIFRNLLYEHVSIRDLLTICETVIEYSSLTKTPDILSEYVRQALCNSICQEYKTYDGEIIGILVEEKTELYLLSKIKRIDNKNTISLEENTQEILMEKIKKQNDLCKNKGLKTILLCSIRLRLHLKRLINEKFPDIIVLSYSEITSDIKIYPLGTIELENIKIEEISKFIYKEIS